MGGNLLRVSDGILEGSNRSRLYDGLVDGLLLLPLHEFGR